MGVLDVKLSNLKAFNDSLEDIMRSAIEDNEDVVLDMNSVDQLFDEGIRADGSEVSPAYRPYTIRIKQRKGQPTDRVTLKDTGAFYAGFFIEYLSDGFSINSNDGKTSMLSAKYGEGIFGLTQENKFTLAKEIILPELLNELNKV